MSDDHQNWDGDPDIGSIGAATTEAAVSPEEELAGLHARVFDLENQLAETTLELSRTTIRAVEAEANLEPAKDRIRRESVRDAKRSKRELLCNLLEVVDNFDRALEAHLEEVGALAEGMRLVRKHFLGTMAGYGVHAMESLGEDFDPATHEAISAVPVQDAAMHGKVVAEVQKGYLIEGEVLRPAKVAVGKNSSS